MNFPYGSQRRKRHRYLGPSVVVIFVHVVGLIEAEKPHFPFHAQMPAQVEIHEAADAKQMVGSVVGAVRGKEASCNQVGATPAGSNYLCMKKSTRRQGRGGEAGLPADTF